MTDADLSLVAELILEKCPTLTLTKSGEPSIANGRPAAYGDKFWTWCKDTLGAEGLHKALVTYPGVSIKLDSELSSRMKLKNKVVEILQSRKSTQRKEDIAQAFGGQFTKSIPCPMAQLKLIECVDEDYTWLLYDTVNDVSYPYSFSVISRILDTEFDSEVANQWRVSNTERCYLTFAPHRPRFFEENKHLCFNTYNKPAWMHGWQHDPRATLPSEVELFLNHLVPGEEDRRFMLSWLKDAVFSRAEQILILRGEPGCGKNIFVETLGANLVGNSDNSKNYSKATRKFTRSSFHSYMAKSQLFVLDEFVLNHDLKETLKDYHNGIAVLEEKFEKLKAPKKLPCSFALIANEKSKIHLDYGDRKFYVPTLNTVDFRAVKPKEWIDHFCKVTLADPTYLQRIASYLYTQVPSVKDYPIHTPQFMELCWVSLPAYMQRFISMAISKRSFSSKQFYAANKGGMRVEFDTLREKVNAFGIARKCEKGVGEFQKTENNWEFISHIYKREDLMFKDTNVRHLELVADNTSLEALL